MECAQPRQPDQASGPDHYSHQQHRPNQIYEREVLSRESQSNQADQHMDTINITGSTRPTGGMYLAETTKTKRADQTHQHNHHHRSNQIDEWDALSRDIKT